MHPISVERLQWLKARQQVLEPVINILKLYVNKGAQGLATSHVVPGCAQAQTEYLLNNVEIGVLEDFLTRQAKSSTAEVTVTS